MPDFLLEIQTEELPAGAVAPALEALEASFRAALAAERLSVEWTHTTSTPRRLVLAARGLPASQTTFTREARGPAVRIAFDADGRPTKAALGFARAQGLQPDQLVTREVKGTPYVFAVVEVAGEPTAAVLSRLLPGLVAGLPWPKSMRWRPAGQGSFPFARPIRGLLALLDEAVVPVELNGVKSGRTAPGHPFLSPAPIEVASADYEPYVSALRRAFVMVERSERRSAIAEALKAVAPLVENLPADASGPEALVDEVTDLVEWPHVIEGRFYPAYLDLPAPVLVAAMTSHQRYFPVHDTAGRLAASFVVVANRDNDEAGVIRQGNERVLEGRLADARFFWHEDRKGALADRVERLAKVVYQENLGSVRDKIERVAKVAEALCDALAIDEATRGHVLRAVHLMKADLVTQMVGEFPELQGVMGREYALADGEPPEVADAIAEHYLPRTAGGPLPRTPTGALASLADKLDSVVACFAVGLAPTGSQDPYALRRQTQGIIRIVEKHNWSLSLAATLGAARANLPGDLGGQADLVARVIEFIGDRLYHQAVDEGHPHNLVRAVLAAGFDDLSDFFRRLATLHGLMDEAMWPTLVELVERTYKIARDADLPEDVDESLLTEPAERALWQAYTANHGAVTAAIDAGDYRRASEVYVQAFAEVVHAFFDQVYVNVDDAAVRANRMLLCRKIHHLYAGRVADLAQVPGT